MEEELDITSTKSLEDFFQKREINLACPICGRLKWVLGPTKGLRNVRLLTDEPGEKQGNILLIEAIPLICPYCGFIRMHDKRVIEQWLKENQRDEGKDGVTS